MGFPLKIGIKRPFNTCGGVYSWDSWHIRRRFVVKPWINVSPNELIIPTNAYESITIQLRCLRMHYEFVTNQLRFLESGVRGQYFEQLQTFATNSRSLKNWKNWLRIQQNRLRTSRTDYDSTTNPNIYQFVAIRGIRGLCGMGALRIPEWVNNTYECLRIYYDSVTMPKNALRICYESTTIFGIGSLWPKFWTAPNFCHEFPIAQELKELTTNTTESVKNFTNWLRFNYES